MRLSNYLQTPDFLASLPEKTPDELRAWIFAKGKEWFDSYPEESMVIAKNLRAFGISADPALLHEIQKHVLLHYYEKMLPLCLAPSDYHRFLIESVIMPSQFAELQSAAAKGDGVVLATCHYGAVEYIAPALAARGVQLTGVLRFSTTQLSTAARTQADSLAASGLFAQVNFIEIGNAKSAAALDMAAVLRRGGVLLAVFDERTPYSVPVTILNKQVWGGAGLDRLIKFAQPSARVFAAFAQRTEHDLCRIDLCPIEPRHSRLVQTMFDHLQSYLVPSCIQWYFLHEEIPFVD
jgi:lauroyl/myristoyl acyltransferase